MRTSNCCTACHCTLEWGLVAALEAEVPQRRTQRRQGIQNPSNEGPPAFLAASFTLHVMSTPMMCSVCCWRELHALI